MALNFNTSTGTSLIRLLPALTSTTLLTYAFSESLFLTPFMHPTIRPQSNSFLPPYFARWLARAKYVIIIGYPATFLAGAANLLSSPGQFATKLYGTGMLFSLAHIFVFGPRMLGLLEDIKKGVPEGDVMGSLGTWLRINWVRAWTTDFLAWGCFVGAAAASL
ncbi:unnamed protein product [Periconia digitata]|uniref:Uncharacterized protein n=1 Tax=Periconia digitata TaxID=1303443 RepID=A0A9W4XCX9_9PLEO|nr:unnamed protein product [Periconia digitata]